VNYDDETLMAYVDGELDELLSAEISSGMERDPALARRVEQHRALRAKLAGAYATVLDQPVPERLLAAAGGAAAPMPAAPRGRAEVLQFPSRAVPAETRRWGAREWTALAASLVLGMLLSWQFLAPSQRSMVVASNGALVARGALARALDSQLASTQRPGDPVQIGLTFRSRDGSYCRSFTLTRAATAGLACRASGEWHLPVTAAVTASGDGVRQAGSPPPEVLSAIEARIAGDALDAAGEEDARLGGWDAGRE
jgi:anti-sigma factor RsiW